jgi:hypothetical protein
MRNAEPNRRPSVRVVITQRAREPATIWHPHEDADRPAWIANFLGYALTIVQTERGSYLGKIDGRAFCAHARFDVVAADLKRIARRWVYGA